jgi:hypothetical protein
MSVHAGVHPPPRSSALGARARVALAACLALASCASAPPPSAAELQALAPWRALSATPTAVYERRQALVRIESSAFSGSYRALLALERAPRSRARLQLFPLAGPKLLDLVVALEGYRMESAAEGLAGAWSSASAAPAPRAFASFLALSLLEQAEPPSPSRVLRAQRGAGGELRLALRGLWPGARVDCVIGPQGELRERHYGLRGVRWSERLGEGTQSFSAPGFSFELSELRASPAEAFPPDLFELGAAP